MPYYAEKARVGLSKADSMGDGTTINLLWFRAFPNIPTNNIAYHIYFSILREDVFSEGVKFVVIDGSLGANIIGLTPGQEYFFCVRPVEYNPAFFNLNNLPIAHDNIRFYPSSMLRQNISATDLIIPLLDVNGFMNGGFPSTGVIQIGIELILYLAVDSINNNLIVPSGTSPVGGKLVQQNTGDYWIANPNNVGNGIITGLSLVGSSVDQNWTATCIAVFRDNSGNPIANTASFQLIGSISGSILDGYGNFITWVSDTIPVTNGIFTFAIVEGTQVFNPGDSFLMQVAGAQPAINGGRGYNNTPITMHTVAGFDGYNTYSPIVSLTTLTESNIFDNIYVCLSRFEYPNFAATVIDGYKQVPVDYLSTDLAAADAANVTFPMYDYSGYHRTDPVLLLNGTCVGSYIGGQMGCIDAYGNYNIYRGMSLQDQNTQRQDTLLSVTGQPACLIKRQQTGVVCSCYLSTSEYQDDRCPFCFIPGTLVRTKNGYRPIEQIQIGDEVLSSDGQYHKVLRTFERSYDGYVQNILSSVSTNPIIATAEHPFLTMRGSHQMNAPCGPNSNCKAFISRGDGYRHPNPRQLPYGNWWARIQLSNSNKRMSLGTYTTKIEAEQAILKYQQDKITPGHMLDWDDAQNIKENDWLVSKYPENTNDITYIDVPLKFLKTTPLGSARLGVDRFEVDEEFLWVVGMYLAEGSNSKRTIGFAIHAREINFRDRLIAYFEKQGYHPSYHSTSENGIVVCINSTTLAQWFPSWLGRHCYRKHIPEELMQLPNNKSWALIQGIYDGDGSKRDHEIGQTSEILALQLSELLHRVGEQPLIRNSIVTTLTPKGNKRKKCYHVSWAEDTLNRHNRKGRWDYQGQLLSKVKQSEASYYTGLVYNLEVEGDHTYIVNGVVVHNCYGTKFVFGYDQYFNPRSSDGRIQVRLSPTPENLKMQEAGLESTFPLDMWTLTVPTIKTRDIIILFDQDDNESFRYEVGDVIRNNTILGLDGGQHLRTFRVRKTDPAYQIRVFRDTADFPQTLTTTLGFTPGIPPHSHSVVVNEKTLSVSQINQTTGISQGHNHPIVNGIVQSVLSHTHQIILP